MTPPSTTSESAPSRLAQALAERSDAQRQPEPQAPTHQLVLFRLTGKRFAFSAENVREILAGDEPVYFVPGVAESVEGVLHLRGHIESVIALNALLGLESDAATGQILMVEAAGIRTGVRIGQLDDVCDIAEEALITPPETLNPLLTPYVSALIHRPDEAIVVLNAEALLTAFQTGRG
ncbi:chemotaxis protein CheW [Halomonas sp. HNIBRBA4712]|uniref:chemotaxis protein CheW n=1 Tax=Halomonas sp. HNIBRBA4712 TaxID=3373087 RepID=UPI0037460CD1